MTAPASRAAMEKTNIKLRDLKHEFVIILCAPVRIVKLGKEQGHDLEMNNYNLWRKKDDKKTTVDGVGCNGLVSVGCIFCRLYQEGFFEE